MSYFFLTIILLLGVITSYEDFRFGKIRNIWIGLALLSGLFLYSFSFFTDKISGTNLGQIVLNTLISSLVGFSLWRAQAWSAGDAKLFIAYAFLLPFSFYAKTFLPLFPSFVIILNSFLLVLFYLSLKALFFWSKKISLSGEEKVFAYFFDQVKIKSYFYGLGKVIAPFLLFMTLLAFLYTGLQQKYSVKILWFQIVAIIIFILLAGVLTRFYKNKYTHRFSFMLFIILVIYGLYKNFTAMETFLINLFLGTALFVIIFPLLHRLIEYYLEETRGHEISVNELSRGMILKKTALTVLGLPESSTYSFIGMSNEQIIQVKNLAAERKIEKLMIGRPFYFALWLFFGMIVTIILHGSYLNGI